MCPITNKTTYTKQNVKNILFLALLRYEKYITAHNYLKKMHSLS